MMNRTFDVRVRLLAGLLFALLALFVVLPQGAFAVGPVIGVDHPTDPGEVMLFKEAAPVPGLVNTWGVTLRVEAMDVKQTADIVLVIDRSGSMRGTRLASAKAAAAEFAGTLLTPENAALPADDPGKVRVAVVSFAGDVSTDQQLTDNQAAVLSAINGINADGGTFTQAGLRTAAGLLNTTADFKNLVLLSDGEPTYSYSIDYDWRMNTANLIAGGHPAGGYSTPTTVPASTFGTDSVGSGSSIWQRYDNPWYSENDKYYNHGNSAIAQSRYFKDDGQNKFIYTIALETEEVGDQVLNGIASGGKAYTGSSADLANIFQDIAGRIKSNVQEATVGDPLGMGFVVEGTVGHIEVTPGTTATYDSAAKEITWEIGTLSAALPNPEPINPDLVGIKYAEMTYQIEVDDDILGAQEGEGGTYSTNGQAVLAYTDAQGEPQEIIFPKPQVDPILFILEKKLYNSLGQEITTQADAVDNRQFDIRITSYKGYDQTYRLYAGQRRVMTNLRLEDTYTVAEQPVIVGTPASVMGDYDDVVYNVYDEDKSVFTINQGDPDSPVLVTNRELPLGKLTIGKVFIPQAIGGEPTGGTTPGTDALAFTFTVTGPTGPDYPAPHQYTFTLQAGKTHTIDNLPYGEYTVVETVPEGFAVAYSDSDECPGSSTTDGKVRLSIDHKEGTVTATNRPTADNQYTGAVGTKQWVNGPAQDHVPVAMQLFADGQLYTPATPYTVSPPAGPATTFTYTWQNLPKYNQYGQAITYTIDEETTPNKYTKAVSDDGLTVTNTYTPDADATATANKLWVDGPATKPTVWFQLWCNVAGGTPEVVPGAEVKQLTGGTIGAGGTAITSVTWRDLVAENDAGLQYVFSVKELDGLDGAVNPPAGYLASGGTGSAAPRTISNTYQIIKDAETATKAWVNGPPAADGVVPAVPGHRHRCRPAGARRRHPEVGGRHHLGHLAEYRPDRQQRQRIYLHRARGGW